MTTEILITTDTPYSLENFKWLMDHSSARSYLGKETVSKILTALEKGDDEFLKGHYKNILLEYLKENQIDEDFARSHDMIMGRFTNNMKNMGKNLKKTRKDRNEKEEKSEKESADKILDEITNT